MFKQKFKQNEKGITLIALVVTIVVLLILAGVSINLVIGQNGIITRAGDAKRETELATANEQKDLLGLVDEIDEKLGKLPSTTETKPYLPTGFSKVEGTSLDTGLVIQDGSGNQYVWVEVPMNEAVYSTAGLSITSFTDEEYTAIEDDLRTYASTYRVETRFRDEYYEDTDNTGWFANATAYNTAKNNMLKSVYENGGFYIGRYETGIADSYRTVSGNATQTPVIKANAYPYNYVTRTQAKVLAESMEHGDRTSGLMFGVQWDLVLAFMHNKGGVADSTLTSNSKTIGNYYNNLWNITNTSAKYSTDYGANWQDCPKDKGTSSAKIILTTGADSKFEIMNIYDIAGNVWEWTLEDYVLEDYYTCISRGGVYKDFGENYPAYFHNAYGTTESYDYIGFRVSLY